MSKDCIILGWGFFLYRPLSARELQKWEIQYGGTRRTRTSLSDLSFEISLEVIRLQKHLQKPDNNFALLHTSNIYKAADNWTAPSKSSQSG